MLSEMGQSERTNTARPHLYEVLRVKFTQTESRMVVARYWERKDGKLFTGDRISTLHNEKCSGTTMLMYLTHS